MEWKRVADVAHHLPSPAGVEYKAIRRQDVEPMCHLLVHWYPDIAVGSESVHLRREFYDQHVHFEGEDDDKNVCAMIAWKGDEIVGFCSIERNVESKVVLGRLGTISPSHRGQKFGLAGPLFLEMMGREMGAELVYYFSTLKIPEGQSIAERLGFKLIGIMPAHDRDMVAPGVVKRVFEAIYAKVLASDAELLTPNDSSLTEPTKRFMTFLGFRPS